jgi:hypothetical protein
LQPEITKLNQSLKELKPTIDVLKVVFSVLADIIGSEIVDSVKFALGWINSFANFSVAVANKITGAWKAVQKVIGDVIEGGKVAFKTVAGLPGGLRIPGFASGVQNFKGGLAVVGERGPELVSLPRGSSVHSNSDSEKMLGATAGGNFTFAPTIQIGAYAGEPGEIRTLAERIYQELMRIDRANGTPVLPNIGVRPI